MSYFRPLVIVCLLLAGLALAACQAGNAATPTPDPLAEWMLPAGMDVPDMTISVYQGAGIVGGEEVQLSQILGDGIPVVLNFWAALCPPCRVEMPELQRVHEARQHEVVILGIDIGPQQHLGTREQGRDLLQALDVHYPAGTTFNEDVARDYRLVGMPATLFIYPDGRLLRTWNGLLTEDKLNEIIDDLLRG